VLFNNHTVTDPQERPESQTVMDPKENSTIEHMMRSERVIEVHK
jgi:hypothetical protein